MPSVRGIRENAREEISQRGYFSPRTRIGPVRYDPKPYEDNRLDKLAQLGCCVKCRNSALYCAACGKPVNPRDVIDRSSRCPNAGCSHAEAKYRKLCPKHQSEKQLRTRQIINKGICPLCHQAHPGPGCLYRKFREIGIRKLTQEQIEWVWLQFLKEPLKGKRQNFEILESLKPEQISQLNRSFPCKREDYDFNVKVIIDCLISRPDFDSMTKAEQLFLSDAIKDGMWRAKKAGKSIGRPKRIST